MLCTKIFFISRDADGSLRVLDGQYSSKLDIAQRSGFIYDRYFRLLSHEKYTGVLIVNPGGIEDFVQISKEISEAATVTKQSQLMEKMNEGIPFTVAVKDEDKANRLCDSYEGLYYRALYRENNETAQHLLGYGSDGKGVTGMRLAYSELLYNKLYGKSEAVFYGDAKRRSMSPLVFEDASYNSRDGIISTVDMALQKMCDGLEEQVVSGCIIIAEADSGQILALSSFPSYDGDNISDSLSSPKGELINRAIYSFTPGSVFKIVISAAALEKDESYFDYEHHCTGSIQVYGKVFRCHKREGHGKISMEQAFANSCNCYYISLAKEIGMERIIDTCRKLGLDKPTEADFLKEANHSFIDGEDATESYLAGIAFGQGDLCLSPLDMTKVVIRCIGGYDTELSLILGEVKDGEKEYVQEKEKKRIFSRNTSQLLCRMMMECVNNGTGRASKIEGAVTGGKTATAQTGRKNGDGVEYVHKWFCGFYEGIGKRYVFCILCENTPENKLSPCVTAGDICKYMKENWY